MSMPLTDITLTGSADADRDQARRAMVPAAVATGALILFFVTMRGDSLGEIVSMDLLGVAATAVVYSLLVRTGLRRESVPVRALVLSVFGLLLVAPAFWSGLPLVLGGAGALLGHAGKRSATRSGRSVAAFVVGLLAVIGYLAIYVGDWIAHPGGSWIN